MALSQPSLPAPSAVPHPGSAEMPPWELGELSAPPRFTARNWAQLVGPGLVMGGAAIGGGEWLLGPVVAARYGGSLLWLATLSILFQVVYNLETSRYTLYTGEPIFIGKFRVPPGPRLWLWTYLALDFGSMFPYLAANAATPLAAVFLGRVPTPTGRFELMGGLYSDLALLQVLRYLCFLLAVVPLLVGGKVYRSLKAVMTFKIVVVLGFLTVVAVLYSDRRTWADILTGFVRFGSVPVGRTEVDNVFVAALEGRSLTLDLSMVGLLAALAAIAGSGGLTNTAVSAYTRDQGWGMGRLVGVIPSVVGGRELQLSHVGTVFAVTPETVQRFRGWYRHVVRDQLVVWAPACFLGVALPSMLSVQFLERGTEANDWSAAAITADALAQTAGPSLGPFFWFMTLFCGFLVLAPSASTTADGFLRRWVDVFWTGSARLRKLDPHKIRHVYFAVLCGYVAFGFVTLTLAPPRQLIVVATAIYNYALGVSCWHTLAVVQTLLPPELRPGWFLRLGLVGGGLYFTFLAVITTLTTMGAI